MYLTPTEAPLCFPADWHPSLGPVLQFFPQHLAACGQELWPDFASLIENGASAVMLYQPQQPSRLSACVTYQYASGAWRARVYCDARMLFQAEGNSYAHVMGLFAGAQAPLGPA